MSVWFTPITSQVFPFFLIFLCSRLRQFCFPFSSPHDIPFYFLFPFSVYFILCVPSLLFAGHTQAIDSFVSESMEALSNRPESMEEIGAASGIYSQILARKPEVRQNTTLNFGLELFWMIVPMFEFYANIFRQPLHSAEKG